MLHLDSPIETQQQNTAGRAKISTLVRRLLLGLFEDSRLQEGPVLLDAFEAGVLDLEHPVQHVLHGAVWGGGAGGHADAHGALRQPRVCLLQ